MRLESNESLLGLAIAAPDGAYGLLHRKSCNVSRSVITIRFAVVIHTSLSIFYTALWVPTFVITSILVSFVLCFQKFVLQICVEGSYVRHFMRSERDLFDGRMLDEGVRERRWTQAFASSYVCSVTG